jgi:hypothetical protein
MTGGDPNFNFRGKWQSEQRCRKNPSPRDSSSVNFFAADAAEACELCASKGAAPMAQSAVKVRTAMPIILIFKMGLP